MQNSSVSTTATATPYVTAPANKPVSPATVSSNGASSGNGATPAIDGRDRLEISSLARKLDVLRRAEEGRQAKGVLDGAVHAAGDSIEGRTAPDAARTGMVAERDAVSVEPREDAEETESNRQQTELARLRRLQEEAVARGEELSVFERERLGRLERIELLVQEGRYSIEPAMMDLLAIRLAKYMISPHA